jgi:hypothetical protein
MELNRAYSSPCLLTSYIHTKVFRYLGSISVAAWGCPQLWCILQAYKHMPLFFVSADLVGFTSMSSRSGSAEEVLVFLNLLFSRFDRCVCGCGCPHCMQVGFLASINSQRLYSRLCRAVQLRFPQVAQLVLTWSEACSGRGEGWC